jgi:hypothetical protein
VVLESLQEIENIVEHLLGLQEKADVKPYKLEEGAKELGIV